MIHTKHDFDVSASLEAARQAQRSAVRASFTGCSECRKPLSIAEIIERHCEKCGCDTNPKEMRQAS